MAGLKRDMQQRERLNFDQLAERCGLQGRIQAERIAHAKQIADLHRDAARLRHGELPEMRRAAAPPERQKHHPVPLNKPHPSKPNGIVLLVCKRMRIPSNVCGTKNGPTSLGPAALHTNAKSKDGCSPACNPASG